MEATKGSMMVASAEGHRAEQSSEPFTEGFFLSQSIFFNTATIFSSKRQLACFLRYAARAVCCLEKAVLEKQRFFFFPLRALA